jgi:hypothetical protein
MIHNVCSFNEERGGCFEEKDFTGYRWYGGYHDRFDTGGM